MPYPHTPYSMHCLRAHPDPETPSLTRGLHYSLSIHSPGAYIIRCLYTHQGLTLFAVCTLTTCCLQCITGEARTPSPPVAGRCVCPAKDKPAGTGECTRTHLVAPPAPPPLTVRSIESGPAIIVLVSIHRLCAILLFPPIATAHLLPYTSSAPSTATLHQL